LGNAAERFVLHDDVRFAEVSGLPIDFLGFAFLVNELVESAGQSCTHRPAVIEKHDELLAHAGQYAAQEERRP